MRGVVATLGAFVLVGTLAIDVRAQGPKPGNTAGSGQASRVGSRPAQDNRVCAELPELRHELARLQHELRQLLAAFDAAKQAGNRQRALQILVQIRRVESQIEDVQHKIRRLLQVCGG